MIVDFVVKTKNVVFKKEYRLLTKSSSKLQFWLHPKRKWCQRKALTPCIPQRVRENL